MNIKNNVLIVFFGLLSVSLFAQAPGALTAGLTSWFKLDNAASVVGSPISIWGGSGSTSSFSISQTVASKRPILNSGCWFIYIHRRWNCWYSYFISFWDNHSLSV